MIKRIVFIKHLFTCRCVIKRQFALLGAGPLATSLMKATSVLEEMAVFNSSGNCHVISHVLYNFPLISSGKLSS